MSHLTLLLSSTLLLGFGLAPASAAPVQVPSYDLIVIAPIGGSSFDASGCNDVNDLGPSSAATRSTAF